MSGLPIIQPQVTDPLSNDHTQSNTTATTVAYAPLRGYYHQYFGIEQVVVALMIALSFYLFTAATFYALRLAHNNLRYTNAVCCSSALLLLLECCLLELEEYIPQVSDEFCSAYTIFNVLVAIGNRTLIYSVLWIRQNGLYTNRLQPLRTRTIKGISCATLVGMSMFAVIEVVTLGSIPQLARNNACESGPISKGQQIVLPLAFVVSSLLQVVLFALAFYPVAKHTCSTGESIKNSRLKGLLLRLSICTSVCVIADFVFVGLSSNKPPKVGYSFIPTCSSINTGLHITAMMFSFADYKKRLWPFFRSAETPKRASGSNPPTLSGTNASKYVI